MPLTTTTAHYCPLLPTTALQVGEQEGRIAQYRIEFKGHPCIGLQLDFTTDPLTHCSLACLNMTTCPVPLEGPMRVVSEVLDFIVFPYLSHEGANIYEWLIEVLERKKLLVAMLCGICPDGGSDGQAALAIDEEIGKLVDTCYLHQLQRSVLYSIGYAGTGETCFVCGVVVLYALLMLVV